MATKEFKAESKKLLDMMINSIYTHKEIFLRELISNASDALDKRHFVQLTDHSGKSEELFIHLAYNKDARTITIEDNGIGMTAEELENNLGTIAKSGSLDFKQENGGQEDMDIIGQFGVGFYSAFMVADKVTVNTKSLTTGESSRWESSGAEGYDITEGDRQTPGTEVILHVKESDENNNYDEFLDQYRLQSLVKKYSDYIRYPIRMEISTSKRKADAKEDDYSEEAYETVTETQTLNSMTPIWKKSKSETTQEELNAFYKEHFYDMNDPVRVIQTKTEGSATYSALLFIPEKPPYNYYTKDYEKGLQLYASGVLIMDKCPDLLPDYFNFVRGLVDSEDLSLNISREMLQHDHQLKLIAKSLEKKIKSELQKLMTENREAYEKFFQSFGVQLKYGVYADYGMHKDVLQDLLLFYSSSQQKPVTLKEYVSRMKEDQKEIYYCAGDSIARIDSLPQTELVKDKGYEILYLTDDVDEFALQMLMEYDGKKFASISADNADFSTQEEKDQAKQAQETNQSLLDAMKNALGDKVKEVKITTRLKSHPVCLSAAGSLSLEMEKVLNQMPGQQPVKAERVLEVNPNHPLFAKLSGLKDTDSEKLKDYTDILYQQALLLEGLPMDDPAEYVQKVCKIMEEQP